MDKNEIATLLEALCERPFAGGRDGDLPAGLPGHAARALSDAEAGAEAPETESAGRTTAALASILSGTATDAQCHGFHAAAVASGALRLEAQSALAFVEGIEQAPLAAPADLVEEALAPAGGAPSAPQPGIWSRLAHIRLGGRRGQVVVACAVMLMAGGLSWSMLYRPAELADRAPVPMPVPVPSPKAAAPSSAVEPQPAPPPTVMRSLEETPDPAASPGPTVSPLSAPPLAESPPPAPVPAPTPVPPAQAQADPCAPRSFETAARSLVEPKAAKPAPSPPSRTAAVSGPDPGCVPNGGTEADRNPQADRGPVRAAKPAAKPGRPDGGPAAAAASAPAAARPAAPAKRPSEFEQRR